MTDSLLARHIGERARLKVGRVGDLAVDVVVLDARSAFGRVDVLVEPVAGKGTAWVRLSTLEFPAQEAA